MATVKTNLNLTSKDSNLLALSCGIHAANAFLLHSRWALVVQSSGWPTFFASLKCGDGHASRWRDLDVSHVTAAVYYTRDFDTVIDWPEEHDVVPDTE